VSGDRLLLQFAKLRVGVGQASEGLRQRQPSEGRVLLASVTQLS
jgi:hypothetical protein